MSKKRADGRTRLGRFSKGVSGNPSGVRKDVEPKARAARVDDWYNSTTGQGIWGRDKRVETYFRAINLTFDQLKELYLGDDLASRAVETIPKEAMRQGYEVSIADTQDVDDNGIPDSQEDKDSDGQPDGPDPSELAAQLMMRLDTLGVDEYLEVCGAWERAYGGAAMLLGVNDGQADLTKPLDLRRVRSLDWVTPFEAREIMPLYAYNDPRAPKYGQPEIYQLNSRSVLPSYGGQFSPTSMMVHESRLVIFPGIKVSRYQVTTARGGWGESVLTRVWRVLRDFNTAWSSAGVLVSDFGQAVYKLRGLWETLAQDDGSFEARLQWMERARSTINGVAIDGEDEYVRQQTPVTGLADLLEKFAIRLAAACDMPLTLLFGTSPAGMNATGESDIRLFYDRVAAYQRRKMVPALRQICRILFRTLGQKQEPDKWDVKFRPLWQESTKDVAGALLQIAQADAAWVDKGILSAEEVARGHWGTGEFNPHITVDFKARDRAEQAAAAPVNPEPQGYVPPPPPGTGQVPPDEVPPPSEEGAAPDAETPPKPTLTTADSAAARRDGDYTAPPAPGTARASAPVPEPSDPAAADPNTPPKPVVTTSDDRENVGGIGEPKADVIVKEEGGWSVYSEGTPRKHLGGPYPTKAEAVTRLRQVEGHKK